MAEHKSGDRGGPEGPALHASCESFSGLLARAADDTLPPESRASLEAHLQTCATCRQDLADQRAMRTLLTHAPMDDLSPAFESRVLAAVRSDADGTRAGWLADLLAEVNVRRWTWRLVPVAVALGLVATLVTPTDASVGTGTTPDTSVTISTNTDALPVSAAVWSDSVSEASLLSLMLSANADDTLGDHRNQEPQ